MGTFRSHRWELEDSQRLVSIVILLSCLALLIALATLKPMLFPPVQSTSEASQERRRLELAATLVDDFVRTHQYLPDSLTTVLDSAPIGAKALQSDIWGRAVSYSNRVVEFILASSGPDGHPGNSDDILLIRHVDDIRP